VPDPYRPYSPGQTFEPSAKAINGVLRAGRDLDEHKYDEPGGPINLDPVKQPKLYNGLGTALEPFAVLGFGESLVRPDSVPFEAIRQPLFAAALPTTSAPWCISREPIPAGGMGDVVTHGPAVVKINVTDEAHAYAVVSDGVTGYLESAASADVPILWKESGIGLKTAQVMLSSNSSQGPEVHGSYASNGVALYFPVTTTPQFVPPANTYLQAGASYLVLANITGQTFAAVPGTNIIYARLVTAPVAGWPSGLEQLGGWAPLNDKTYFHAIHIPCGPFGEDRYIAWEVYMAFGTGGQIYGLVNGAVAIFGNTSIYCLRTR